MESGEFGQALNRRGEPGHGAGLHAELGRDLVDVEVEEGGARALLMADQRLDVAQALRRIACRRLHRGLDRDLDVLDPAFLVVLGPLRLLGDGERTLLAVRGLVEDRFAAVAVRDAPALAERDARAVDVLADDDER